MTTLRRTYLLERMRPGTILPNGAVLIEAKRRENGGWKVLAAQYWMAPGASVYKVEYVTWVSGPKGSARDLGHGHYHMGTLLEAVQDYEER